MSTGHMDTVATAMVDEDKLLNAWVQKHIIRPFQDDVGVSATAAEFLESVARAQLREGIKESAAGLVAAMNRMPVQSLLALYRAKYGPRVLTFNRAVRLVADLHDQWITVRHHEESPATDNTADRNST